MAESRKIGLARALSKLGYCSRSQGARLIRAGRVRLNGVMRRDPETPVHLERDQIEADGVTVSLRALYYLMVNKPRGVVTTASDERGRKTVYSLLGAGTPWVSPVGRLDMASEGLLLLTNDSEWAARISDPGSHLDKTYHVQVSAIADETLVNQLGQGLRSDGEFLRTKSVRILRTGNRNSWLEIVLDEGKNRHIRRMLDPLRVDVLRLVRVAIGPLALGRLAKGEARALAASEKLALDQAIKIAAKSNDLRQR